MAVGWSPLGSNSETSLKRDAALGLLRPRRAVRRPELGLAQVGVALLQQGLQRVHGGAGADDAVAAHLVVVVLVAQHVALAHALGRGLEDVVARQALVALAVAGMQRLGLGGLRGAGDGQAELAGQLGIDVLDVVRVVARLRRSPKPRLARLARPAPVAGLGARGLLRPLAVERGVEQGGEMLVQRLELGLRRLGARLPAPVFLVISPWPNMGRVHGGGKAAGRHCRPRTARNHGNAFTEASQFCRFNVKQPYWLHNSTLQIMQLWQAGRKARRARQGECDGGGPSQDPCGAEPLRAWRAPRRRGEGVGGSARLRARPDRPARRGAGCLASAGRCRPSHHADVRTRPRGGAHPRGQPRAGCRSLRAA